MRALAAILCLALAGQARAEQPPASPTLGEAEAALRAVLAERPDLPLPRLELARIHFLRGEDRLAREHFERVLAADPPPPVAANINGFLERMRARRRWSAHFGFALAPDTNVGADSERRTIATECTGVFALVCGPDGVATGRVNAPPPASGIGLRLWGGWERQHPVSVRARLRFGADLSRTEHAGSRFDSMTLSGHAGPRVLLSPRSEASLLAVARRHWSGGDPERRDLGARIETRHRLDPRTSLSLRLSRLERRHDRAVHADGPVADASVTLGRVFTPTLRGHVTLGASRERPERARGSRGRSVNAGLSALLPRGFTVGASLGVRRTDYEGTDARCFGGCAREDETRTLRLSVHRRDLTLRGFSPELSLGRERRTSTAQTLDYERTFGNLAFVRPF